MFRKLLSFLSCIRNVVIVVVVVVFLLLLLNSLVLEIKCLSQFNV